ncbi:MAG TPA: DUF2158 domain-containing protein [Deltaproteobacteria bacterium]|nr:DUF2158 domain-containing protein [Deltaproteobacteria bacterium]HNS90419.1 DUF2158 domain-containing protein [Deltaproteobacteria bacterium]HOY74186.1 DUF2158 domain-containing protein [Deltaproteobacteria bacterium]HPO32421.1 DUF2158 domain-containing protein [Deltaproteobacteria bacterium]HQO59760.1 DUF2158 domain-containing protein [Deltaproteobacteria bacterium]
MGILTQKKRAVDRIEWDKEGYCSKAGHAIRGSQHRTACCFKPSIWIYSTGALADTREISLEREHTMGEIKKGDVVKLKSGSPAMTVENVDSDGTLSCVWYDNDRNEIVARKFSYECLDLAASIKPKKK